MIRTVAILLIGLNILLAAALFALRHEADSEFVAQHQAIGSDILLVEELETNDSRLISYLADRSSLVSAEESVRSSIVDSDTIDSSQIFFPESYQSNGCDWLGPFQSYEETLQAVLSAGLDEAALWSEAVEQITAYQVILTPSEELVQSFRDSLSAVGIDSYAVQAANSVELAAGLFNDIANAESVSNKIEELGLPVTVRPVQSLSLIHI